MASLLPSALCVFLLLAVPTFAAADGLPTNEVEAGAGYERLTKGLEPWSRQYVDALHRFDARAALYGGVQRAERFDRTGSEAHLGAYHPLGARTTGVVEGAAAVSGDIFPDWSVMGQIEQALPLGFGVHLGYRHRAYDDVGVDIGMATLERYWGDYRAAYTWSIVALEGDREANHRFDLARYYGHRSHVGVSYVRGRELEATLAVPATILFDIRYYGVAGRHWLNERWAISWSLGIQEQGDSYKRRGGQLGVRRAF